MDTPELIRILSRRVRESDAPPERRKAAEVTGGVPVYADIDAVLVIDENGQVLEYDPQEKTVRVEDDPRWQITARIHAARTFAELAHLYPVRSTEDRDCEECGGTGRIRNVFDCAACRGLGWKAPVLREVGGVIDPSAAE